MNRPRTTAAIADGLENACHSDSDTNLFSEIVLSPESVHPTLDPDASPFQVPALNTTPWSVGLDGVTYIDMQADSITCDTRHAFTDRFRVRN